MARGGKRAGGGRGGGGRKGTGIEKYGKDADDVLGLNDDDASEGGMYDSHDELEEHVMAGDDEDDDGPGFKKALKKAEKQKKKDKKKGAAEEDEDDEAFDAKREAVSAGTAGWRGQDFYGGEDAGGDTTDGGSEEELTFQEAKRLEELRAKRLGGLAASDPMAVLLGGADIEDVEVGDASAVKAGEAESDRAKAKQPAKAAEVALAAAGVSSQFESVFEAQAETSTVKRDISQLSEAKRKALVKKEAPELAPLLEDYKTKLAQIRELLPLLQPKALAKLPKSGAIYLQSKAALLLNTLANLAFYVLLRAEGGSVRTHPVVSQLVWLKELQEKLAPLDTKLHPKLKKAAARAKKALRSEEQDEAAGGAAAAVAAARAPAAGAAASGGERPAEEPRSRQMGLRERLERARASEAARQAKGGPSLLLDERPGLGAGQSADVADLLRLPGRRKAKSSAGAPVDLEEDDPTVGAWLPQSTLSEQVHFTQQYLGEASSRAKQQSADLNVEARPRRARQRLQEDPEIHAATTGRNQDKMVPPGIAKGGDMLEMDDEDMEASGLVKDAMERSKKRKEKKSAAEAAREEAKLLRQYRPEVEVDGRRKTSKRILDNRGLVRQRKKSAGNARVANRQKYEKMVKRRKGAVQEMRQGAADGATYEGEATGVRTHVKKSHRLG